MVLGNTLYRSEMDIYMAYSSEQTATENKVPVTIIGATSSNGGGCRKDIIFGQSGRFASYGGDKCL